MNSSFVNGVLPGIVLFFKSKRSLKMLSNVLDPINYRLLSTMLTFSNIYERLKCISLVELLETNTLINMIMNDTDLEAINLPSLLVLTFLNN